MTSARARVYLVGTPTKFDQGAESPQTAFELTSRAPPQSFAKAGPEYGATVGATVRSQRNYDDKQPGDPVKAAAAVLHIALLSEPPLRLLLGSDAYNAAEKHAIQVLASDRECGRISASRLTTGFQT